MVTLPEPVIVEHEGILVVRDDLLPGGTKRRAMHALFDEHEEYVYASPVYGYAQVALAYATRDHGKRATIFCAERRERAPLTLQAIAAGATIQECSPGYLSVVRARAREYCEKTGAVLLPFGLDDGRFIVALADIARALPVTPKQVWTVVGSGVLSRALQLAWPDADFQGVQIGSVPKAGNALVLQAPEKYEQNAQLPPPFPSCLNYDAKAWRFIKLFAKHYHLSDALFWNVAA